MVSLSTMMANGAQDVLDNWIEPGMISRVADAAGRAARFPSPIQGDRVFRNDVGYTETYYDVASVSNIGGRATAGWYRTSDWIDTAWITTGVTTAQTGWTTAGGTARYYIRSGWVYALFYFTRTGGTITVPVDGDVATQNLATFDATAYLPTQAIVLNSGSGRLSGGVLASSGLITLTATTPGASIVNTDVVGLTGSWPYG
jgi:hypothetical protein